MKRVFALFTLLICTVSFAQQDEFKEISSESLMRVWGLVKYKHPNVSRGGYDMDQEFLKAYTAIETIKSEEVLNTYLKQWIKQFDSSKRPIKKDKIKVSEDKLFTANAKFEWVENSLYDDELQSILIDLKENSNYGKYYLTNYKISSMVKFNNEKALADFSDENESHRMLFLSSFWNSMRYGNVNIYLTDTPWDEVLTQFIPRFEKATGVEFEYLKDKLFVTLNDSHSDYEFSRYLENNLKYFPLFHSTLVKDSLVIVSLMDVDIAKKENLELRDVVFSIDGQYVKEYLYEKFGKYISLSNKGGLKNNVKYYFPLVADKQKLKLGIRKTNGNLIEQEVSLVSLEERAKYKNIESLYYVDKFPTLSKEMGYINLEKATKKNLKESFKDLADKKVIILDLRNYPLNISPEDIANYILPERKKFMGFLGWYSPAYGQWEQSAPLDIFSDPFSAGRKNKNYYKGKIVLLVDNNTVSKSEFIAMAIQQAPDCVTIGTQTGGAVMNRIEVSLVDGTTIDFTGGGAFYPNDRTYNVQRNGVKIDHIVPETASDYNVYGVMQYALDVIKGQM